MHTVNVYFNMSSLLELRTFLLYERYLLPKYLIIRSVFLLKGLSKSKLNQLQI